MARTRTIVNSLNAGEWSPLMEGRSDLAKYKSAAKTLLNVICFKQGGVTRRPGTRFVNEVKDSSKRTRLIPFEFSTIQSHIIEIGDLYMRFYENGARIESPPATPVEIVTPYTEDEIFDIHFAQSADVVYIAHPNHAPMKLSRTSDIAWTLTEIDFLDGPYLAERTDLTITPAATTGATTLTASAPLFQVGHVGSIWRLKHGTTWGYAEVTGFTSSTVVNATVITAFGANTASVAFREGAWSDVQGYPGAVTLFQQRSFWAGSAAGPDTIWGSQSTEFENMNPGTGLDDEAITFTLASNKVNAIRWISPGRSLLLGTVGSEWQLGGGGVSEPITPGNPNASLETSYGSNNVSPVQLENVVLFVQRAGRKIRELTYSAYTYTSDAYTAADVTALAEHITKGGIVQMDYEQEATSVVWLVRADGALLGLTYEKEQDVKAWHRHITGAAGDLSDGKFESVAVIPHPTADEDQTWVIVNRTIGGLTKRYVEYLETQTGFYGKFQVDAGLSYSGAAASTLSGLDHLEGQTVDILGNGSPYPQQVVTGGQVTGLSPKVTQAEVGLHFDSEILTLQPEGGGDAGTAQGARKRFNKVRVRVHETVSVTVNGQLEEFRTGSDPMSQAVPLFSGDKEVTTAGWDDEGRIRVQQTQPLPLTLLAIMGVEVVND